MKKLTAAFWLSLAIAAAPSLGFAWGHEGHQVIDLIAEHCMTAPAKARASELLDGGSIEAIASWADDYRRDHPETGPWHYINIPLADSNIDMARERPEGQCVIAQTAHGVSLSISWYGSPAKGKLPFDTCLKLLVAHRQPDSSQRRRW